MTYSYGDYCYSYGKKRSTTINIGCAPDQMGANITSVEEDKCNYTVQYVYSHLVGPFSFTYHVILECGPQLLVVNH